MFTWPQSPCLHVVPFHSRDCADNQPVLVSGDGVYSLVGGDGVYSLVGGDGVYMHNEMQSRSASMITLKMKPSAA